MNIFKRKKKINIEIPNNNKFGIETLMLYCNSFNTTLKDKDLILTGLIILFDKKLINEYLELVNNNSIKTICKEFEGAYYIYIYGNLVEYKNTIKTLNPNSLIFKSIIDLCKGFRLIHMKEFIEEGIINGKDINIKEFSDFGNYFIQNQYSLIPNHIFSLYELSKIIKIKFNNTEDTIFNFIQYCNENEESLNNKDSIAYLSIKNLFKEKTFKNLFILPSYKKDNIFETYEDEIYEPIEGTEEIIEIKEDEDGNLIYDKTQFL